jgi:hypothetical protein
MMTSDELVTYLAERGIEVTRGTLRTWRFRKTGPEWHKIGHRVYYAPADVRTWLSSTRHETAPAT